MNKFPREKSYAVAVLAVFIVFLITVVVVNVVVVFITHLHIFYSQLDVRLVTINAFNASLNNFRQQNIP